MNVTRCLLVLLGFVFSLGATHASDPSAAESAAVQMGIASYYASLFQDRVTANGERYDENQLSAAHREYPFGTRVRVTSLENGKSVIVRINDRGPYKYGRIIDLSRSAAQRLGMLEPGLAKVKVEVLD